MSVVLNYNQAISSNFKIELPSIPDLEFYAQSINMPTFSLGAIEVAYQDERAKIPDNKFEWDEITIQFTMDEELYVYEILLDWIKKARKTEALWEKSLKDINLIPLDSNKNIEFHISAVGAFPTNINGWHYTSTNATTEYITLDVSFAYQDISISRVKPLSFSITD